MGRGSADLLSSKVNSLLLCDLRLHDFTFQPVGRNRQLVSFNYQSSYNCLPAAFLALAEHLLLPLPVISDVFHRQSGCSVAVRQTAGRLHY